MRQIEHRIKANGLTHFVLDSGSLNAPCALLLHGFPDSHAIWSGVTPRLVEAGYRVIAPDLRGFGVSDMAAKTSDYEINVGAIPDMVALLDRLDIRRAHVVGHDFGAPVAWSLSAQHPSTFVSLTAISVGHIRAFLSAGWEQKKRSWYILFHQIRWLAEQTYRFNDWQFLRLFWECSGEVEQVIDNLKRPGRLSAALGWYRANMPVSRMINPPPMGAFGEERVSVPTLGLWSTGERFLTESQMLNSNDYVDAPWQYVRIEGASHWIPYDKPDELAALLIGHWRTANAQPPSTAQPG